MSATSPKQVALSADFGASPLWVPGPQGLGSVGIDAFPLSVDLKGQLTSWAARFDRLQDTDYEWPSEAEHKAWTEEGSALAARLSEELGPEYSVAFLLPRTENVLVGDRGAECRQAEA